MLFNPLDSGLVLEGDLGSIGSSNTFFEPKESDESSWLMSLLLFFYLFNCRKLVIQFLKCTHLKPIALVTKTPVWIFLVLGWNWEVFFYTWVDYVPVCLTICFQLPCLLLAFSVRVVTCRSILRLRRQPHWTWIWSDGIFGKIHFFSMISLPSTDYNPVKTFKIYQL